MLRFRGQTSKVGVHSYLSVSSEYRNCTFQMRILTRFCSFNNNNANLLQMGSSRRAQQLSRGICSHDLLQNSGYHVGIDPSIFIYISAKDQRSCGEENDEYASIIFIPTVQEGTADQLALDLSFKMKMVGIFDFRRFSMLGYTSG